MAKNFTSYWNRIKLSNSGLSDEQSKLTITVSSLKIQLEKAYKQGEKDEREFQKELAKHKGNSPLGDIFGKESF